MEVDLGWRLLGSTSVTPIVSDISAAQKVHFQRLLHSSEDNQGIIEIVANNTATAVRTQAPRWSTTWSVDYRWHWVQVTSTPGVCLEYEAYWYSSVTLFDSDGNNLFSEEQWGGPISASSIAALRAAARPASDAHWNAELSNFGAASFSYDTLPRLVGSLGGSSSPISDSQITCKRTGTRTTRTPRITSWSTHSSGTAHATNAAASEARARTAANAVDVGITGRPNANAVIEYRRNVGTAVNTQGETVAPAGTANFTNQEFATRVIIGSSEKQA